MAATVKVNEKEVAWTKGTRIFDLRDRYKPDADVIVYNGFPVCKNVKIHAGDQVCFIRRGEVPNSEEMKRLMVARHSPEVYEKICNRSVGIAGVGGLGSSLAIALARLAIGNLVIVDFDVVEPSNLNRQQYFMDQIGMHKVEALRDNLYRVNPYIQVTIFKERVDRSNVHKLFGQCDVVAECFDNPESKSELVEATLRKLKKPIVAVSGIAGYDKAHRLICRKVCERFFLVGDGKTAAQPGIGLMAPKVGIAAHLQANKVLELLLEV